MKKILLVTLVFKEIEIIEKHIESILPLNDVTDIIVLENNSEISIDNSSIYFKKLLQESKIYQYWLFEKNIGGSAFHIFFNSFNNNLENYEYVIITDGDLVLNAKNWLEESLSILNNMKDAFSCAVNLDTTNLPIESFPDCHNWIPNPIDHGFCLEAGTGFHMLLLPMKHLINIMGYINESQLVFVDGVFRTFCSSINKKWLKTKKELAYHLTWDLYKDKNNSYTKFKLEDNMSVFRKVLSSNFTVFGDEK